MIKGDSEREEDVGCGDTGDAFDDGVLVCDVGGRRDPGGRSGLRCRGDC